MFDIIVAGVEMGDKAGRRKWKRDQVGRWDKPARGVDRDGVESGARPDQTSRMGNLMTTPMFGWDAPNC